MNPYYSYACAAPNYAYAYSATPNHYIQMPQGPYGSPTVVPLQPGVIPGQPYYPQAPAYPAPSEWHSPWLHGTTHGTIPEHMVRCVTKEGKQEWTHEWRYTYTTPSPASPAPRHTSHSSGACTCSACTKKRTHKKK